jgi:hypothetical protein
MTVWVVLAIAVIVVVLIGGYSLFQAPGRGPAIQQNAHPAADRK